jgi:hypothetical protein
MEKTTNISKQREKNDKILELLMDHLIHLYQKCSSDRRKLHEYEWEHHETVPSILGEVEVLSDSVVGLVRSCIKKKHQNFDAVVDKLEHEYVFDKVVISDWVTHQSVSYKDFLSYLLSVELLRVTAIKMLRNEK